MPASRACGRDGGGDFDLLRRGRYNSPPHEGGGVLASSLACELKQLARGDRLSLWLDYKALPPIRANGTVQDRTAVNAFPGIKDEEEVREPLHHHQAITLGTSHVSFLLPASLTWGTKRCRLKCVQRLVQES